MDEAERQKKIEAGKLKLERYKKKKNSQKSNSSGHSTPSSKSESSLCDDVFHKDDDEKALEKDTIPKSALPPLDLNIEDLDRLKNLTNSEAHKGELPPLDVEEIEWMSMDLKEIENVGEKFQQMKERITEQDKYLNQLSKHLEVNIEKVKQRDENIKKYEEALSVYQKRWEQARDSINDLAAKNDADAKEARTKISSLEEQNSQLSSNNKELETLLLKKNEELTETSQKSDMDVADKNCQIEMDNHGSDVPIPKSVTITVELGVQVDPFDFVCDEDIIEECHNKCDLNDLEKMLFAHYQSVVIERDKLKRCLSSSQEPFRSDSVSLKVREWEQDIFRNAELTLKNSLNRIAGINNITKTINYLLTGCCFTTADDKFRMSSGKVDDSEWETSKNGKSISLIIEQSSLEVMRCQELSQNLSSLTAFLQQEMDLSVLALNSSIDESRTDLSNGNISSSFNGEDTCLENWKLSSELAAKEEASFKESLEKLNSVVKELQLLPPNSVVKPVSATLLDYSLQHESMPLSNVSLVSLSENTENEEDIAAKQPINGLANGSAKFLEFDRNDLYTIVEDAAEDQLVCPEEDDRDRQKSDGLNANVKSSSWSQMIRDLKFEINHLEEKLEHGSDDVLEKISKLKALKWNVDTLKQCLEMKRGALHETERSDIQKKYETRETELLSMIETLKKQFEKTVTECDDEKAKLEFFYQNQLADLVTEHDQDLQMTKENYNTLLQDKVYSFNVEKADIVEKLNQSHSKEVKNLEEEVRKCMLDETQKCKKEFDQAVLAVEAKHSAEVNSYRKKIETLFEEKCTLLEKSKKECEDIIARNNHAIRDLCTFIESAFTLKKTRMESKSNDVSFESSFIETLDELNQNIQKGIDEFCKQSVIVDDQVVVLQTGLKGNDNTDSVYHMSMCEMQQTIRELKEDALKDIEALKEQHRNEMEHVKLTQENDRMLAKMQELKSDFEHQLELHRSANVTLGLELSSLTDKLSLVEKHNAELKDQLNKSDATCDMETADIDDASVSQAAQTNSRLLHVLSDLVKTFLDIENEINVQLVELGLTVTHTEAIGHHDEDNGQSVGSREDFTGIGEGPHLELHEDGPDLTPRAWDLFTAMGAYDADIEGEDVVISASRRLRLAVEHVLHLLSMAIDRSNDQEFKAVLKKNEDLCHELQEESEGKDLLQMQLVTAASDVRRLEGDKQKLEDENYHLTEEKKALSSEVNQLKSRIGNIDDEKDKLYEEKKHLREQMDLLSSRLADPEKMKSGSENLSRDVPELLHENTRLASEKLTLQKSSNKENQVLRGRIHELEQSLDDVTTDREEKLEKMKWEMDDLKAQLDSADKQLASYKKFINEQTIDREQEREDSQKEIKKLNNCLREKEKAQQMDNQRMKETETLESQLKAKIEEHRSVVTKKESVEQELRQALDKIHDLREVITELEKQLESKSRSEMELIQKLSESLSVISAQEKRKASPKHRLDDNGLSSMQEEESLEKMRSLEEQLVAKSEELAKANQSETLIRELRGQIHFLEAKVVQKTKKLEAMNLAPNLLSPVLSDDGSHNESHDGDLHQISYEDGNEISPRSIHWIEIRRLEDKICRLLNIEEEIVRQNVEMNTKMKKVSTENRERDRENAVLLQQAMEQRSRITELKTHIDELRHRPEPSFNPEAFAEIRELRDRFHEEEELKKKAWRNVKDLKERNNVLELQLSDKNKTIQSLLHESPGHTTTESKMIQTDLSKTHPEASSLRNENFFPQWLKAELSQKNKVILQLTNAFSSVQEELANLQKESEKTDQLTLLTAQSQEQLRRLSEQLCSSEAQWHESRAEIGSLMSRISELETVSQETKDELELEQVQLEKDFNTVQDLVMKKENELCSLQEETENLVHLEAKVESLKQALGEQKSLEETLREKLRSMNAELEKEKESHIEEINVWKEKIHTLSQKYKAGEERLRKQISVLKENTFFATDRDDIDLIEAQEKIVGTLCKLKDDNEESMALLRQVVYHILDETVKVKTNALSKTKDEVAEMWQRKLDSLEEFNTEQMKREMSNITDKCRQELEETSRALKEKHNKEMKRLLEEKDTFWQVKLKELESRLLSDRGSVEKLLSKEGLLKDIVNERIDEVKKHLTSLHQQEVIHMKEKLKDHMTSLRKAESKALLEDYEKKFLIAKQLLRSEFEGHTNEINRNYQKEMKTLREDVEAKVEEERKEQQFRRSEDRSNLQSAVEKQWMEQSAKFKRHHEEEMNDMRSAYETKMATVLKQLSEMYDAKLQEAEKDFESRVAEERTQNYVQQQSALQKQREELEEKFRKEQIELITSKMQQLKTELEQRNNMDDIESQSLEQLSKNVKMLEEFLKPQTEAMEKNLIATHEREINELNSNFKTQRTKLQKMHDQKMREMQKLYNKKINEANDIIRGLKAGKKSSLYPEKAFSVDGFSSEDTGSSCAAGATTPNTENIMKSIYSNSRKILTLSEKLPSQASDENLNFQTVVEERVWIFGRLKYLYPVEIHGDCELKVLVDKASEEIVRGRKKLEKITRSRNELHKQTKKPGANDECIDTVQPSGSTSRVEFSTPLRTDRVEARESSGFVTRGKARSDDSFAASVEKLRAQYIDRRSDAPFEALSGFSNFFESPQDSKEPSDVNVPPNLSTPKHQVVATPSQTHQLYQTLQRVQSSYNALVFQKNYLLSVLGQYQCTEDIALAAIKQMGMNVTRNLDWSSRSSEIGRLQGRSLFRSAVDAVIFVLRLKSCVHQREREAVLLSPSDLERKINAFCRANVLFPYSSESKSNGSAVSITSTEDFQNNSPSNRLSKSNSGESMSMPGQGQLYQYVDRLGALHKQLGLSDTSS